MKDQYIIRVRQTKDLYFLAEGEPHKLLEQLDNGVDVEDFEFLGEKSVSTFTSSVTLATEAKIKEIEQYAI